MFLKVHVILLRFVPIRVISLLPPHFLWYSVDAHFYQRVSIASYASAGIAKAEMSVCLSVRLSVTLRYCIKTKKASALISSPSESLNIPVSINIWLITKFKGFTPSEGDL